MEPLSRQQQQQQQRNSNSSNNNRPHQRSRSMTPSRDRVNAHTLTRLDLLPSSRTPPPYLQQPLPSASCFDFASAVSSSSHGRSRLEHSSSAPDGCFANYARSSSPYSLASRRQSSGSGAQQVLLTSSSQYRSHFSDVISEWRNELLYGTVTSRTLQQQPFPLSPRSYAQTTSPLARTGNNNSVFQHGGTTSGDRGRSSGEPQLDRLGVTTSRLTSLLVRL